MRYARLALASAAIGLLAPRAHACSCSGQGPASALTRPDQTWGVRLSERLVLGQGAWNAHSTYQPFATREHDRTIEYSLLAAYRWKRIELSSVFAYGARMAEISSESARTVGWGDVALRGRFEALEEPMPWQKLEYPALALLAGVRLPTAEATGIAPRGSGAVELSIGVSVERTFARDFRAGIVGEFAGRLPDTSTGVSRRLGPRATAEATLSYFAARDWVLSTLIGIRWEGDVVVGARRQYGTAQRLTEVGAVVSWQPWSSPFRAGFAQRYAPALDALGANTVQNATSELWLAYVR